MRCRSLLAIFAITLLASSCGSSTDELDSLRTETGETITQLEADLEVRDEQIVALEAELSELEGTAQDAEDLTDEVAALTVSLTEAEASRDAAIAAAEEAEAREQELLAKYDVEIRAEAQAAWDDEVASACAEAGDGTGTIASYVTHTEQLGIIGTRVELIDAVVACAQPLRNRSEDERLAADCETGDPDALLRGTSEFVGDCLVMFVIPFQWDSRTSECNFLANWESANLGVRYSYRYEGDGLFQAPPVVCADDLDGADQDDLLQIWVEVEGTYNYDTAAGGTNAVPQFTIVKAVLVAKD